MEPVLGAVTRLWLMENREPGSSLCKAHLGLPEVRGTGSREGWRVRRLRGPKATSVWLSHIWALLGRPRLGTLTALWFFQVENFDV